MRLETPAQRAEFIRKALQANAGQLGNKQGPNNKPAPESQEIQPPARSKEGEASWSSSSERMTSERMDLNRSTGGFSSESTLTRWVLAWEPPIAPTTIMSASIIKLLNECPGLTM